jgi:hypothetical protein
MFSFTQEFPRSFGYTARQRIPKPIRLQNFLSINLYTEFEQASFDHIHLNRVFSSHLFRRTDGNPLLGWSHRTIADFYLSHDVRPPRLET